MIKYEELMVAIHLYAKKRAEFEVWSLYQPVSSKKALPTYLEPLKEVTRMVEELYEARS